MAYYDPIKQIHKMREEQEILRDRIAKLQASIESISPKMDKLNIKATAFNTFEERMAILVDMKTQLMEREAVIQRNINRVMDACRKLPHNQMTVIYWRIEGLTFEQIGTMSHYSTTSVYYSYRHAIQSLKELKIDM